MSDSLWPHALQHARLPQLSELAQTHVHPVGDAIQTSYSLSSPSPPALNLSQHQGSFPITWLFASGSQSTGVSASASVLPMNIQGWFPLGLTGLISLLSKELLRDFSRSQDLLGYVHLSGGQGSLACCTPWTHRVLHNLVTEQQFI